MVSVCAPSAATSILNSKDGMIGRGSEIPTTGGECVGTSVQGRHTGGGSSPSLWVTSPPMTHSTSRTRIWSTDTCFVCVGRQKRSGIGSGMCRRASLKTCFLLVEGGSRQQHSQATRMASFGLGSASSSYVVGDGSSDVGDGLSGGASGSKESLTRGGRGGRKAVGDRLGRRSRRGIVCMAADYYSTLGVPRSASKQEIKNAYRRLARKFHPDVNKEAGAEDKFKEISNAYEVLSDDDKRPVYDQYGEAGIKGFAGGNAGGMEYSNPFDLFESFFGAGFGNMSGMGGGMSGRRRQGPTAGEDIRFDLSLEFKEAVFGIEKEFDAMHLETCGMCNGTGAKQGTSRKPCKACGGMGQVMRTQQTPFGSFSQVSTCAVCVGEGEVITDYCRRCGGEGRKRVKKTIKLKVPAGVNNGSCLRVRGEGDAGMRGGPSGDLYVYLAVRPHPDIERDGMNLYSKVSVDYTQAILGVTIQVNTVDGIAQLEVPGGTQPGDVLVLSKLGVPKLGKSNVRGDHYFTVRVTIPTKLSESERNLVEELASVQQRPTSGFGSFGRAATSGAVKRSYRNANSNATAAPGTAFASMSASVSTLQEEKESQSRTNANSVQDEDNDEEDNILSAIAKAARSAASGALKWLRENI